MKETVRSRGRERRERGVIRGHKERLEWREEGALSTLCGPLRTDYPWAPPEEHSSG